MRKYFTMCLLILFWSSPLNIIAQGTQVAITFQNAFADPICSVYFSTSQDWGGDQLAENERIEPNASRTWQVTVGDYNVRLENCDGSELYEVHLTDFTESRTIVYGGTIDVTIVNESDIYACYVAISTGTGAGRIEEVFLAQGDSYRVLLPVDTFSLGLWSCEQQPMTSWESAQLYSGSVLTYRVNGSSAAQTSYTVTIDNQSSTTICMYYFAPTDGTPIFIHEVTIESGGRFDVALPANVYNVSLADCEGQIVYVARSYQVAGNLVLTVAEGQAQCIELLSEMATDISEGEAAHGIEVGEAALEACQADQAMVAQILNNLATLSENVGEYRDALAYYTQALALVAARPSLRLEQGKLQANLAVVYARLGQYTDALTSVESARTIAAETQNAEIQETILTVEGGIDAARGQYRDAIESYESLLQLAQTEAHRRIQGAALNSLGSVYQTLSRFDEAERFYQDALSIAREDNQADVRAIVAALANLGTLYAEQGRYADALLHFNEALSLSEQAELRASSAFVLVSMALVYFDANDISQAMAMQQRAMDIRADIEDRVGLITLYNNSGLLYMKGGDPTAALTEFESAYNLAVELEQRGSQADLLVNMAAAYHDQGDLAMAESKYQEALNIRSDLGDTSGATVTMNNLATLYSEQANYAQALTLAQQAVDLQRLIGGEDLTIALSNLGGIYEQTGQIGEAITAYQEAVENSQTIFRSARLDELVGGLATNEQNWLPYQRLAVLLTTQGDPVQGWRYAEQARAIVARTQLVNGAIDFHMDTDETSAARLYERLITVEEEQNLVDSLLQEGTTDASDQLPGARAALEAARNAYTQYQNELQLEGGYLSRELALNPAALEEVQAALPEDTTLLVYAIGEPNSVVFLMTRTTFEAVPLEVARHTIDEFTRGLASNNHNGAGLRELYTLIFAPIASHITTLRLMIAADGPLNYISFAALQPTEGRYLIDNYALSMIPSGTTLVLLRQRAAEQQHESAPGIALAQPEAPISTSFLEYADDEAVSIAQTLGGQYILDATESDLRREANANAVVSISAHVQLLPDAPLFSAIYLRNDPTSGADGRFEVREVYELDLSSTELVLLSGCDTAAGRSGEDFGTLTRAFLSAGTPRVTASLWSVDDRATADLLSAYVRYRAEYENEADALRQAMLDVHRQFNDPNYWSSFVLVGLP